MAITRETGILGDIMMHGFLTGSRAFGTYRPDSDWDIVYPICRTGVINAIISDLHKTPSDYFAGYYVETPEEKINLIPVHPHEYFPWFLATQDMIDTFKWSGITSPIKKYAVFMSFVSTFKGTVEELRNLSEYKKLWKKHGI